MNKFNFKSLVAVLLTVLMVFSILPVTVSAAETTTDKKYTFADYAKGEQYAMEEVHVLDNVITVTTSDAHFREELRMYDSEGPTGHNSIAVITSTNVIRSVVLNVGNNVATLNVYGSTDGTTWTLVEGVAVVKNYADYTVNMPDGVDYTSLKLDVEGLKQLRVKYMTLTLVGDSTPDAPACEHKNTEVVNAKEATETEEGYTGDTVCKDCGATVATGEKIPVKEPAAPAPGELVVITAPKAGVAYKFGMVQKNVGKTFYLKGGMSSYYMATSDKVADAIDVYLEETDGGYYLYTMVDGVKTYINMVVSGTHVNGAYEATASTVYTWDAEHNTIISVVNGKDYWHGTRNDKTYTTVGPCATSYNGFYCQFYGAEVVEPDVPTVCPHTDTEIVGAKDATKTEEGYTGDKVCTKCGETVEKGTTIPKIEVTPTGDAIIVVVAAVLLAGAALMLISRKRSFN